MKFKTNFEDDGLQCKRDIQFLKLHPECGLFFYEDKPFEPSNKHDNFKPSKNFTINSLSQIIPDSPPLPPAPPIGSTDYQQIINNTPFDEAVLPQDYTGEFNINGRRILVDSPFTNSVDDYIATKLYNKVGLLPRLGTYEGFTPPVSEIELPSIEFAEPSLEDNIPIFRPPRALVNPLYNRVTPLPDPRDEELIDSQMQDTEGRIADEDSMDNLIDRQIRDTERRTRLPKRRVQVPEIEGTELVAIEPELEEELILREAERFIRRGRPQISMREAEGIVDKFLEKGVSRSRTLMILEEAGVYDAQGEFELSQIADPKERAMIRRMRAQRILEQQN